MQIFIHYWFCHLANKKLSCHRETMQS